MIRYLFLFLLFPILAFAQSSPRALEMRIDDLSKLLEMREQQMVAMEANIEKAQKWWAECVKNPQCVQWLNPQEPKP